MNFSGLVLGFAAFLIIGMFHPLVIKAEYYFGKGIWPLFFVAGVLFSALSLFVPENYSIISGIIGFSLFWSTVEIFKQHERVVKGQAKANPEHLDRYKKDTTK